MTAEEGDRCARPPFKAERDDPHVADAITRSDVVHKANAIAGGMRAFRA
jgi:hypothetical protein